MHETALVRDIVRRMVELARSNGACRVAHAKIWLGAMSHLSAEHFREHFVVEAQGTAAARATLEIEVSDDPNHPDARHVRLANVSLEEWCEADRTRSA